MQNESIYDKLFSVSFGHNFNLSRYTEKRIKCGEVKAPATLVLHTTTFLKKSDECVSACGCYAQVLPILFGVSDKGNNVLMCI